MKRILTIQDISCVGRCSLTAALPIISCLGVETAVLPTAVLSSHTAFRHFSVRDLTEDIPTVEQAWLAEGISFDSIYSGYLGSERQVAMVEELWKQFPAAKRRIVDPAMADQGRLYPGFDGSFVEAMKGLCARGDVILPNVTELYLLTGACRDGGEDQVDFLLSGEKPDWNDCRVRMKELADRGTGLVIVTGYEEGDGRIGAIAYDRTGDDFFTCTNERIPASYHGTGDIFASVVTGALARGADWRDSVRLAVDFVHECLVRTMQDPDRRWYGVDFEAALPWLCEKAAGWKE